MNSVTVHTPPITPRVAAALFDEEGFLIDTASWSHETACHIAERVGIGTLTPEHRSAISCVRGRYLRYGSLPPVRLICRACGLDRDAIERLFGGYKNLWRVAGLPDPGEEAKAYMS
jgi:TusE/DsrC/DsvC family sulfur relay protein